MADEYAAEFLAHLDGYTDRVDGAFRQTVGRCGPLSNVYNATDVTLCSNVVYPFVSEALKLEDLERERWRREKETGRRG